MPDSPAWRRALWIALAVNAGMYAWRTICRPPPMPGLEELRTPAELLRDPGVQAWLPWMDAHGGAES